MPRDRARTPGLATLFGATGLGEEQQRCALARAAAELGKITRGRGRTAGSTVS
jgi:hypothetical protein